jgi:ribonucleoside-diphosphate reductase alpha chain
MKITSIKKLEIKEHTWDISTLNETYILSNGCISHNTSSQITNSTNGIEPPRGLISVKASKDGILKQVVPEIENLKYDYDLLWDIPNNKGYLELVGIMQKFVDQSISANTNYDPARFEGEKVPLSLLLQDLLLAYKVGVKTLYYHNTRDRAGQEQEDDDGCSSGACKL